MEDIFNTESTSKIDYIKEYEEFQNEFKIAQTHPEQVGILIMKMAGHYAHYNMRYVDKLKSLNAARAKMIVGTDEQTGKPISATKADTLSDATNEASEYQIAKMHLANIECYLNALKALQKSLSVEFSNQ
jgi:hypothetical protein